MRKNFFLRQLVINRRLQWLLMIYSGGMCLFGILAVQFFTLFYSNEPTTLFGKLMIPGEWVIVFPAAAIFCSLWAGLIMTNRVAGPIYRLQRHMKATIAGKEIGPFKIRKGDFFQDVAITYNEVMEHERKKAQN